MKGRRWNDILTKKKTLSTSKARVKTPGCVIRGQEADYGENCTLAPGRHKAVSTDQTSHHAMAEFRLADGRPENILRTDKETTVTFQVVSFRVQAGTQPTSVRGLFTEVTFQHHPQKCLWKPLPKSTREANRRNLAQPCKTCPSDSVSSASSQMSVVEGMTAYRKQRPQKSIQSPEASRMKCINYFVPQLTLVTYSLWARWQLRIKLSLKYATVKGERTVGGAKSEREHCWNSPEQEEKRIH